MERKLTKVVVLAGALGVSGAICADVGPRPVQSGETFEDVMVEYCAEEGKVPGRSGIDTDGDGGFWTCTTNQA